ncbi:family 16 glycosylhydrolase [Hymenobacter sp. 15J16-1T3B]|nr:family 16 glycosylhydrolase [Hymenobacter sp. 15J16-1T3B]
MPILLAGLGAAAHGQSKLDLSNFHVEFEDNFNYSSHSDLVNNSPWKFTPANYLTLIGNAAEDEYYDASACSVNNGYLTLQATPLPTPFNYTYTYNNVTTTKALHYKSGWIEFKDDFVGDLFPCNGGQPAGTCGGWSRGYTHGIFEIRCKLAPGTGTWPAFWLYNGPTEIDVFEGYDDKRKLYNNIIYSPDQATLDANPGLRRGCQNMFEKQGGLDLAQEFHNYAVAWTPTKVTFFFDGREIRSVDNTVANGIPTFGVPATVIANLAINNTADSTSWPSAPQFNGARFVNNYHTEMVVDYIRVWKPNTANDYSHYKFDNAWKTVALDPSAAASRQVAAAPGNLSASATTGQVFYHGGDGWLRRYYPSGSGYAYEVLQPSFWQSSMQVQGDVVAGDNDFVAYKGVDNRVQYYYYDNGSWHHNWADDGWARNDLSSRVSDQPGALALVSGVGNSLMFYRGLDNRLHQLQYTGGGSNGWQHTLLAASITAQQVAGDVAVAGGQVYYAGADGRLQSYWNNNGVYQHAWIDDNWGNAATQISSQYGALAPSAQGVYYRGGNDDRIHRYYYASGWQYQELPTSADWAVSKVAGKLTTSGGQLFYRGPDDKMHLFYPNPAGTAWTHDWPSSWGYLSPATLLNGDNFSAGAANQPIFFKNPAGFVGKFEWGPSENLNPECASNLNNGAGLFDPTAVVYRGMNFTSQPSSAPRAQAASYQLYPNPADGEVTLTGLPTGVASEVTVYNTQGQVVLHPEPTANGPVHLSTQTLKSGFYVVRVRVAGKTTSLKLTVTH